MSSNEDQKTCSACGTALLEPYIRCSECGRMRGESAVTLCLHCFAKGSQPGAHVNSHSYEVIRNDFALLCADWTAAEELRLLEATATCGLGNWVDIARQVRKPAYECKRHYRKFYIENQSGHFENLPDVSGGVNPSPIVLKATEHPPRPAEGSTLQLDMSGYVPARGDFNVEFNNFAELDLAQLDFDESDSDVERDLKLAVLDIYWRAVKERYRRKRLVHDYGLINFRRHYIHDRKYYRSLGSHVTERMRVFGRQLSAIEWDKMMEGLHLESQLKKQISQLCEYRRQGIRGLRSARIYAQLNSTRQYEQHTRHLLDDALTVLRKDQWMNKQALLGNLSNGVPTVLPQLVKREVKPLDITGLPHYEKLSDKEKEFCASARFTPHLFLHFKKSLIAESTKMGPIKLATARQLLKIDVNKTRKIYDFLADEGLIRKEMIARGTGGGRDRVPIT